ITGHCWRRTDGGVRGNREWRLLPSLRGTVLQDLNAKHKLVLCFSEPGHRRRRSLLTLDQFDHGLGDALSSRLDMRKVIVEQGVGPLLHALPGSDAAFVGEGEHGNYGEPILQSFVKGRPCHED